MMTAVAVHILRRSLTKTIILCFVALFYVLHLHDDLPAILPFHTGRLLRRDARLRASLGALNKNLVALDEGISRGPWIAHPSIPSKITTDKPYTFTFACTWGTSDICPKRYIVLLRGPIVYTPPLSAITSHDNNSTVSVTVHVPEPGEYELFAWPDFEECPKFWREHMHYPVNRGQVMGTPTKISVVGRQAKKEGFTACTSPPVASPDDLIPSGRWLAKSYLEPDHAASPWARSYATTPGPEWMSASEWVYQPYECKRPRYDPRESVLDDPSVTHILFMGDSVLRGAFCTQVWPAFSSSGSADGECTFINDRDLYHVAPKSLTWSNGTRNIDITFRFLDDKPVERLVGVEGLYVGVPETLSAPPSHIVINLGLWMAVYTVEEYRDIVEAFLIKVAEIYPQATIIWRTTTDVAPQITCFSDKGMTRGMIAAQHATSLAVIEKIRRERGINIRVVDAYAMTTGRPDVANDGRHWVIESPEENGWMRKQRPFVGDAERAVMDATWEVIVNAKREQAREAQALQAQAQPQR